ncbi:helix-turn-helix transcriptional regulator [Sneathiella glossodoripedis]|uniref:helix-turn-helix transcriptional regulator n=1 Tax=Sneathiella glossodoripedis TaxID=418853 RepID=UPI00046EF75A|nr:hypothetical protein [Sneathiella glossodoripedis]
MKARIEPRGLPIELAAQYVGLSLSTFSAEVKKGLAPEPTWLTKNRKVWLREKLDDYLDRKDKGMEVSETWSDRIAKLRSNTSGAQKQKASNTHTTAGTSKRSV